jgi:hypothetical protein
MEGCKMSVRPLFFKVTILSDSVIFPGAYNIDDNYNFILRTYGTGANVRFCSTCHDSGYLSPANALVESGWTWDTEANQNTSSVTVCEKHAADEFENFLAIGK